MTSVSLDAPAAAPPASPDVVLRRLTASLAHNVNNALTGVIGYLELALNRPGPKADADGCVRSGLECAYQAADAVRRIVSCARRISEAEPPGPQSLRRLAEDAAERLARTAPNERATTTAASAGPVTVSPDLVGPVLDEMLQAAGAGAMLRVVEEDGRCALYVEATAAGGSDLALRLLEASLMVEVQGGALEVLTPPGRAATLKLSFPRRGEAPLRRDDAHPHLSPALGLLRRAV